MNTKKATAPKCRVPFCNEDRLIWEHYCKKHLEQSRTVSSNPPVTSSLDESFDEELDQILTEYGYFLQRYSPEDERVIAAYRTCKKAIQTYVDEHTNKAVREARINELMSLHAALSISKWHESSVGRKLYEQGMNDRLTRVMDMIATRGKSLTKAKENTHV